MHDGIGRITGAVDLDVLAPEPQRLGEHGMAHAPGRGADLAPGSGHGEDNGLGDLIEDDAPALDIAKSAQTEFAQLHLQQIADLVQPVLPFVDPGPRVRDRIGQEP